jgi:hypothetical protein
MIGGWKTVQAVRRLIGGVISDSLRNSTAPVKFGFNSTQWNLLARYCVFESFQNTVTKK